MVEGDEGEGEESPEDEGVGDAGERALADDFGLAEDFPDEVADAPGDGVERPAEVFAGGEDVAEDRGEAEEEERCGGGDEEQQQNDFDGGEVLRFGEIHTGHHTARQPQRRNTEILSSSSQNDGALCVG